MKAAMSKYFSPLLALLVMPLAMWRKKKNWVASALIWRLSLLMKDLGRHMAV